MTSITQADRDAAAAYWHGWSNNVPEHHGEIHPLVHAFARHREAALTTAQAETEAQARVIYLLQTGGARFHKAIRAIQADCPPEIAKRIDKALADNTVPPAGEWAEVERLREALERLLTMPGDVDLSCNPHQAQVDALNARREVWNFARAALSENGNG